MKRIHKYTLQSITIQDVNVHLDTVLDIQALQGRLFLYCLEDIEKPMSQIEIVMVGTDKDLEPIIGATYFKTVQHNGQIIHIFTDITTLEPYIAIDVKETEAE